MIEILKISDAARLVLMSESGIITARRYEDEKLVIALKQAVSPDDTIVIWEKLPTGNIRVYEISCCPSMLAKKYSDPLYLRGHWEDYLTNNLLKVAKTKIDKKFNRAFKNKVKGFEEWMEDTGITIDNIRTGEVEDESLFQDSNTAQD